MTPALLCLALLLPIAAEARIERSAAQVLAFKRHNPCPSTGLRYGRCEGWEIDHVMPLCAGGADDHRTNFQWLSIQEHRVKTLADLRVCRYLRKISVGQS